MAAKEEIKTEERKSRKVREGVVTSDAMDKTVVVTVTYRKPHPQYRKTGKGDKVRIGETRPLSATKRWRLVEILEKAK